MSVSIMQGPDFIFTVSNEKTNQRKWWQDWRKLLDAYPHLENSETHKYVQKAYDTGDQLEIKDHELKSKDGQVKYINYILKPVKNISGHTEYIISVGYDVTEDVLNRRRLKASEQQLKYLATPFPIGVESKTQKGMLPIIMINGMNTQAFRAINMEMTAGKYCKTRAIPDDVWYLVRKRKNR